MSYAFVVNAAAGRHRRDRLVRALAAAFPGAAFEPPAGAGRLAPCDAGAGRAVVAVGGDGTVNRLLPALAAGGSPLGVIPAGTANDLARAVGIPLEIGAACRSLETARPRSLDLLSVNGRLFATGGGIGLAADAAWSADRWKRAPGISGSVSRRLGARLYALSAAKAILAGPGALKLRLRWCGGRRVLRASAVLITNVPTLGGRFRAAPEADPRDGQLDLLALPPVGNLSDRAALLRAAATGSVDTIPGSLRLRSSFVTIVTTEPARFIGDGETLAEGTRFHVRTRPAAITVLVPRGDAEAPAGMEAA